MRYSPFKIRLAVPPNNEQLLLWAFEGDKLLDGHFEFSSADGGQPVNKVYFKKGRCARYEEVFVVGNKKMGSYTCRLEIAAQEITTSNEPPTTRPLVTSSASGRLTAAEPGIPAIAAPAVRTVEPIDQATAEGIEQAQANYAAHITRLEAVRATVAADNLNPEKETIEKALARTEESYWDLELAKLSEHVYSVDKRYKSGNLTTPPPAGWNMLSEAQLEGKGLSPEMMINPTTGFKAAVYRPNFGPEPPKLVLAFAGTDDKHDVKTDIKQGIGMHDKQYVAAAEAAQTMKKWVGRDGFEMTGHSMGGGLASMGTAVTGARATTINAAGLHNKTAKRAGVLREELPAKAKDIRAVHSTQDGLTKTQKAGKKLRLIPEALGKPVPVTPRPDIEHSLSEVVGLNPKDNVKATAKIVLDGHGKTQLVQSLSYQMDQDTKTLDTYLASARPS